MNRDPADLLAPRILLVDDERQIHSAVRLRIGREYSVVCCLDPATALQAIAGETFDLCITDVQMPQMDGFDFIEAARKTDPDLGYVVFSGFDSDRNLRRAIPLQVCEFIPKPLPDRAGFELRLPVWIEATRQRRRERSLAKTAGTIAQERDVARLEREVELVASETARDALLQSACLLTTIQAHLAAICSGLSNKAKTDPVLASWIRNLEEARKTADAAVAVTGSFFDTAYANRDSSPALINAGLRHATTIAQKAVDAESTRKEIDVARFEREVVLDGLTGIEFLLMMIPAISAALLHAADGSTVRLDLATVSRLDGLLRAPGHQSFQWFNRSHALGSHGAIVVTVTASAPSLSRAETEAWLRGNASPLATVPARGLVSGVQKCKGLLGVSASPEAATFRLIVALPHTLQ